MTDALRQAAERMRRERPESPWIAVADWLDAHGHAAETLLIDPDPKALAVARAYLGETE
jgi:hypothetical protein